MAVVLVLASAGLAAGTSTGTGGQSNLDQGGSARLATREGPRPAQLEAPEVLSETFTTHGSVLAVTLVYNATQNMLAPAAFQLTLAPLQLNQSVVEVALRFVQVHYGPYPFFLRFTGATTPAAGTTIVETFGTISFHPMSPAENLSVWVDVGVAFRDATATHVVQLATTPAPVDQGGAVVTIFDPAGPAESGDAVEEGLWFLFWEVPPWAFAVLLVLMVVGVGTIIFLADRRKKAKLAEAAAKQQEHDARTKADARENGEKKKKRNENPAGSTQLPPGE